MAPDPKKPKAPRRFTHTITAFVTVSAMALALLGATAPGALAGTVTDDRPFLFAFDGGDTTAGRFENPKGVAVDNSTGFVYATSSAESGGGENRSVCKFDPDGTAVNFSATGNSCLLGTPGAPFTNGLRVAVDNSGGPNQGRLLVSAFGTTTYAFAPSGELLWTLTPPAFLGDIAVDATGHPWLMKAEGNAGPHVWKYTSTGSPPAQEGTFTVPGEVPRDRIDLDKNGNCYIQRTVAGEFQKFAACNFAAAPTLFDSQALDLAVDQSSATGHIFTTFEGDFQEYASGGALLGTFGEEYLGFGRGGISYSPSLDRVYVVEGDAQHPVVAVFGPKASGTVPDATIDPPSEVKVSCAHLSGTVNPQGVVNAYRFEWRRPSQPGQFFDQSWATGGSSPEQSLPVDSLDHEVSYDTCALQGNTTFEVRLVGVNTDNDLRGFSPAVEEFTTETPDPPTVTLEPASGVTTDFAHLEGTIDPQEDAAAWSVETTTAEGCATSWAPISPEPAPVTFKGTLGPQPIEYDLSGLLPAQHYCVRVKATNGGGSTLSNVEELETVAIPPSDAETSFAAPRLDTSVRLNGLINPQGSPLTYFFELSEDGGESWTALPELTDSSEARTQRYVAQELGGLDPDTTYSYRFNAENDVEGSDVQGGVRSFTTRTTAEVTLPPNALGEAGKRGIELVNTPDKGNQNDRPVVPVDSAMSPDGEKALWTVFGGAPGGTTATGDTFLARRTAAGWVSQTLMPPVEEQLGLGNYKYELRNASPDFSLFAFTTAKADPFGDTGGEGAIVRLGEERSEEILREYPSAPSSSSNKSEFSDDGAHLVLIDPETNQLQDIGGGGQPETLSVLPDGNEAECGLDENHGGGSSFIGGGVHGAAINWRPGYARMASDGSRAYFQVEANGDCDGLMRLWVRNRTAAKGKGKTTEIDPGAFGQHPELIRVTPDGRRAYFTTFSDLDPADSSGDLTGVDRDLYHWEEAAGKSSCLTCVVADAKLNVSGVSPVMISDDFSHAYFHRSGGIYVLSDGQIRFVSKAAELAASDAKRGARLSADGNVLAFTADGALGLTADAVASECPSLRAVEKEIIPCTELYRYDDRDASLECVSCRRGGLTTRRYGSPTGNEVGLLSFFGLSRDGSTIAFPTAQALLPSDVNNDTDVYEWRNGAVRLITDGVTDFQEGAAAPVVAGVDADGSDIAFSVTSRGLTGFEQDGLANLYDARIGGGFAPPSPPVHCAEDSCQGPLQAPPAAAPPSSAGFSGRGNGAPPPKRARPCARKRGKAKRRCVRKQRRAAARAEKRSAK